jgi:hypothetical protein
VCEILSALPALAGGTGGTIKWDDGYPNPSGIPSCSGKGTFTLEPDWVADGKPIMYMFPTAGGKTYSGTGEIVGNLWGPITITDFPAGKYNIVTKLKIKNKKTNISYDINTEVKVLEWKQN